MRVSYSAPAKMIISGEHASVYGKPTLITALNLRLQIELYDTVSTQPDTTLEVVSGIVAAYLRDNSIRYSDRPYGATITSDIPRGSNLGSSAALSVAACAAFLEFYSGKTYSKDVVNALAYEVEKTFHGTPSGGDNSASCYGGLVYFRKEFEFLKSISRLAMAIPSSITDRLFIISSGAPKESTKDMVDKVRGFYTRTPRKAQKVFDSIEQLTKQIVLAVKDGDAEEFESCIEQNQKFLEALGVVSPETSKLLKQLKSIGVGKVTGAGGRSKGSGNLLFIARKKEEAEHYLKTLKIEYMTIAPDTEGLKRL